MGGPAHVVIDGTAEGLSAGLDGLFAEIEQLVAELEQRYSRYREDSLVSLINRRAGSPSAPRLTRRPLRYLSSPRPLGDHWWLVRYHLRAASTRLGFPDPEGPAKPERIEAARDLIGWEHLDWHGPYLRLPIKGHGVGLWRYCQRVRRRLRSQKAT